jgi:hypothetical protein
VGVQGIFLASDVENRIFCRPNDLIPLIKIISLFIYSSVFSYGAFGKRQKQPPPPPRSSYLLFYSVGGMEGRGVGE